MRIIIDLDGTICPIKKPNQLYGDLKPLPGAVAKIKSLRASGHYIIIATARHMATCEANVGLVVKRIGKLTLDWLDTYGIEYDEIFFGKPNADVTIDDRSVRFTAWKNITEKELISLAKSR